MSMMRATVALCLPLVLALSACVQEPPTTPEGFPAREAQAVYDELDFQRATQAYLWAMPLVSVSGSIEGMQRDHGTTMQNIPIYEDGATPKQVILTANSQSIYSFGYLDLSKGPVAFDVPPGGLGGFNNAWEQPIIDIGPLGPDKGKGGKYLLLPPGYNGDIPEGYFTAHSDTYWILWLIRGSKVDGKAAPAVAQLKQMKVYPLARKDNPPAMSFFNASTIPADIVFKTDLRFWETLHRALEREPIREQDKAMLGMLAPLGIEKGKPFKPDDRARAILERAAKKGLEMARTITFQSRSPRATIYEGKQWERVFVAEDVTFNTPTYLDWEARVTFAYPAEWSSPAVTLKIIGAGSQYALSARDADGEWLDGALNYTLHLEPNIPVVNFWSVMAYDAVTRSQIDTDQGTAGVDSYGDLIENADGSIDLYFGPRAPRGKETNWIKTREDRGFFFLFRWYGPTEPYFDQSWQLNDVEKVK